MKGQYRIISELILFGLGIVITTYVIVNFNGIQDNLKTMTAYDQLNAVADSVSTTIVKVSSMENASIFVQIPLKISESPYRIQLTSYSGGTLILRTDDAKTVIKRQLFNINYDNIVPSNSIINDSEVSSAAEFIRVVKNEKITIVRA